MTPDVPVQEIDISQMDLSSYYTLIPTTVEGVYLVNKLIKTFYQDPKDADIVVGVGEGGTTPTYWLHRRRMTAAQLGRVIGRTEEQVEKAKSHKLMVKQDPSLPQPTVPYWGEA